MTINAMPSCWIIMRHTGNGFRDPTEEEIEAAKEAKLDPPRKIDNGVPRFAFEGPEGAYVTEADAEAAATALMEKDGVVRWVFKSASIPEIRKVITFNPTNGPRKLKSVPSS